MLTTPNTYFITECVFRCHKSRRYFSILISVGSDRIRPVRTPDISCGERRSARARSAWDMPRSRRMARISISGEFLDVIIKPPYNLFNTTAYNISRPRLGGLIPTLTPELDEFLVIFSPALLTALLDTRDRLDAL